MTDILMLPRDEGSHNGDELARSGVSGQATDHFSPEIARADLLDFIQHEYAPVVAFLMQCGAIRQDAEDAVQEAFIDAWKMANQPGAWERVIKPRGWIRTVAFRKYQRPPGSRKRPTQFLVPEVTDTMGRPRSIDHNELTVEAEYVRSILRELEPGARAVMAFHIDGFSSVDIAHHLQMTDQKVRDLYKKGKKTLSVGLTALREQDRRQVQ